MPGLKVDGNLRPDTRVKPRSAGSDSSRLRFWCRKRAGTAPKTGIKPARSAMPAFPETAACCGSGERPELAGSA